MYNIIVDGHCDTLQRAFDENLSIFNTKFDFNMTNAEFVKPYIQFLASFINTKYDIGNTAYDVSKIVEEVKNAKIDDDEMVKYVCQHDLAYQIRNFYLVHWTKQIHEYIDKSNNELKQHIIENL